jgi:hypothetical protein
VAETQIQPRLAQEISHLVPFALNRIGSCPHARGTPVLKKLRAEESLVLKKTKHDCSLIPQVMKLYKEIEARLKYEASTSPHCKFVPRKANTIAETENRLRKFCK